MSIDNVLIEIDGPEMPIMDGSAKAFVKGLKRVGLEEQEAEIKYFVVKDTIKFEIPEREIEFLAVPDTNYRVTVMVDYRSVVLGTQHA